MYDIKLQITDVTSGLVRYMEGGQGEHEYYAFNELLVAYLDYQHSDEVTLEDVEAKLMEFHRSLCISDYASDL